MLSITSGIVWRIKNYSKLEISTATITEFWPNIDAGQGPSGSAILQSVISRRPH